MKSDDNIDEADILQALIAEFLVAANRGEPVDRDALLKQHPECADSLLDFFSTHDRMVSAAGINSATLPISPSADEQSMLPLESAKDEDTLVFLANRQAQKKRHSNVGDQVRYFGNYELLSELARGGMGVVYKARQVNLNRIVAVKMILSGQLASTEDVSRFYVEAEAAASLDHPGIVPIYEIGQHEGQHFFAMAFVEGMSLQQLVRDGPRPPQEAAKLTLKVAEAISYAHEKGVIHRDLKPANVLLDHKGEPKVTDFGLASKIDGDSGLTRTGAVMGTPSYMPPEQASGKLENVGPRSDVYSIGAILYCLLTGRPPFQSANPLDTLIQVLEKDLIPPRTLDPKLPIDLNTVCLKCLEKDPERRYATAKDLSDDLQRYLQGEPITAKPPSLSRLVRHWIGQNIGAIGWAVVVGVLLGLLVSLHTLQTEIAPALSAIGTQLDRLGFAREFHLALAHLPIIPPWLHAIQQFILIVLFVMTGLIVVALVRPKNRPADVIAGTLSGTAAASVWFLLCLSWAGVYGKMQNTVQDMIEIQQAESSGELSRRVQARYPRLQFADPEKKIQIAWNLARHRQITSAAMGMIQGLITSMLVFVPACLCQTMLAGRLTRQRKSVRAAVVPYMEIGLPFGVLLANLMMNQLLIWLGLAGTSAPLWMSTLLYFPLIAAIVGASKPIRWPWRVFLHLLWVAAVAAMIIWSVQVVNESRRPRPVLGVASEVKSNVCLVERVLPGSPAARADLRPGDVIEEIDGQAVSNFEELVQIIQGKRIGQTVNVIFRRDGTKQERQVELLSTGE